MEALRERCTEVGALLIFDEVMTGFGRTGRMFALEHWPVAPDIVVMAKALGGGLPLGAFAGPRPVMQCLSTDPPLAHVTTFGGNPVSCAAGLAALEILQKEHLPARAKTIGEALLSLLQSLCQEFAFLKTARGLGCLLALEFHRAEDCQKFTRLCMQNGIILGWTLFRDDVIRWRRR
ncbi:MAG: aminotransferase class III-fold pyridoxal phosphate-dependent enzyme [candidate division KSB1 bacterium]|nr:aminotransferase class III-fold pyridoxal phosphate-dependent enzyme [candidate division KSB1 bacterium]